MKWIVLMAVVCNLNWNTPVCVATNASAPAQPDGTIFVNALDGNGNAVRYNLNSDFVYTGLGGGGGGSSAASNGNGQSSGLFTGLVPGTYTVYARSSNTCRITIQLTVGANSNYAIRYRLDFHDLYSAPVLGSNRKWRLHIEDSQYSGAVTDLEGAGDDPVQLSWRGESSEEIYEQNVISSELRATINSQTDQQFLDFYTYDERRFRGSLYEYSGGSYVLRWQGYLLPMLYSEPYVSKRNYDINLVFTDGLADLAQYPFTNDDPNAPKGSSNIIYDRIPLLNALVYILRKTGISLDIWETVNLYATGMASGTNDSTLEQAYLDPKLYINSDGTVKDCRTVLGNILDTLGCKLYQANGKWHIDLISEKTASAVATRKRTSNFGVITGGNESPRVLLRVAGAVAPKVTLAEQSGMMSIPQTYGTIKIKYDLGTEAVNNLLEYGNFEDEDIVNGQLKGWQVDLANGANVTIGLEEFEENKNALFIDFDVREALESVVITSKPIAYLWPTQYTAHRIKLKFDVYTRPLYTDVWIRLDYKLQLTNSGVPVTYLLQPDLFASNSKRYFSDDTDLLQAGEYNRVFITEHLTWKTVEAEIYVYQTDFEGDLQVEFAVNSNPVFDYETTALLKAVAVASDRIKLYNNKARVLLAAGGAGHADDEVLYYDLVREIASESIPDVVQPVDYHPTTNPYVWRLQKRTAYPTVENGGQVAESFLQSILIRNVQLEYLPNEGQPRTEILVTETPNSNVKQVLEKTIYHGDLDTSKVDLNYKFITSGWLSTDATGTPITGGWKRRGATENYTLQQLLGKMIRGQYQEIRWKLSGLLHCPDGIPTLWNTLQEVRTGKVYQFVSLTMMLRTNKAEFEAIETLSGGDPLDESTDPGGTPGTVEPPVDTRVHTPAFTTAFN